MGMAAPSNLCTKNLRYDQPMLHWNEQEEVNHECFDTIINEYTKGRV